MKTGSPPSDRALFAQWAEKMRARGKHAQVDEAAANLGYVTGAGEPVRMSSFNGVALGPDSPMLRLVKSSSRRKQPSRIANPSDFIDPSGAMNGAERRRAEELEAMRRAGVIRSWKFGALSLQLAKRTWYRPDFLVVPLSGRLEIEEIKGHWEDDARVKIKVAARLYPEFGFRALIRLKKKQGGGWREEIVVA